MRARSSLTRRSWLCGLCLLPIQTLGQTVGSIARSAQGSGRFFGCAVRSLPMQHDPAFASAVLRDCSVLTPEVALKWAFIQPEPARWNYSQMDALAEIARNHGKTLRGHTLLWHRSIPGWAEQQLTWTLVADYFRNVMSRYGDVVSSWDVVNEPIDTGRRIDGLRESPFLYAFGQDYIARALREARQHAPRARLLINEFGLEYTQQPEPDRRFLFLELLRKLRRDGAPLDGVGLQTHLDLAKGPIDASSYRRFLNEIARLGLDVTITELDVKEADYIESAPDRDRRAGEAVAAFLAIALPHPAVRGVMSWGLSDRYSWLAVSDDDRARYPTAWKDGSNPGYNRGLPLDSDLKPKPIYRALAAAFDRIKTPG